jgi:rod shape-determining protein MreD
MIMPRGHQRLLLPVRPWFVALSLLLALLLELLPVGPVPAAPSPMAVVITFWAVHQSRLVGVGWAFVFGLLVDVGHGALLGQHALSYAVLAYGAVALHRRLLAFGVLEQALQVLPLFLLAQALEAGVRMAVGGMTPSAWLLLAPPLEALLWPLAHALLLAPQRRPPDRDQHRPL